MIQSDNKREPIMGGWNPAYKSPWSARNPSHKRFMRPRLKSCETSICSNVLSNQVSIVHMSRQLSAVVTRAWLWFDLISTNHIKSTCVFTRFGLFVSRTPIEMVFRRLGPYTPIDPNYKELSYWVPGNNWIDDIQRAHWSDEYLKVLWY